MTRYWLMKSEPETFSIQDLAKAPKQSTAWDGVRNYQARNFMRDDMRVGDGVLFYHSNAKPPGIAGLAEVSRPAFADPSQFQAKSKYFDPKATSNKPIWYCVEIKLQQAFAALLPLDELKKHPQLKDLALLKKGSRLSVQPVSPQHWQFTLKLASSLNL